MSSTLIVLGHGSRNPAATEQFNELVEQVRARRHDPVLPAFMELAEPSLAEAVSQAVAAGADAIIVQPCFLFDGMHIRRDIPEMLSDFAAQHPQVAFRLGRPIGPDPRVADVLLERAAQAAARDLRPDEIEARSMAIIDELMPVGDWTPAERTVVKRLVHTSGDPSLAAAVRFSAGAAEAGAAALRAGAPVITDTDMVRTGVNEQRVLSYGGTLECLISDPRIAEEARRTGRTRAACAMRAFGARLDGAVVALGNAPTALREVLRIADERVARPALVVGMPVGFVDAAESKDALMASDLAYVAVAGTRGGSPLAAATVNALLRVAEGAL